MLQGSSADRVSRDIPVNQFRFLSIGFRVEISETQAPADLIMWRQRLYILRPPIAFRLHYFSLNLTLYFLNTNVKVDTSVIRWMKLIRKFKLPCQSVDGALKWDTCRADKDVVGAPYIHAFRY